MTTGSGIAWGMTPGIPTVVDGSCPDPRARSRRRFLRLLTPALVGALVACGPVNSDPDHDADELASRLAPFTLPAEHVPGETVFDQWCASCHGPLGVGSDVGPPLVHRVYRPAHHSDAAFRFAVRRGVRAHHWTFGDMPALPDVSSEEVEQVVAYLRWLQQAVGID